MTDVRERQNITAEFIRVGFPRAGEELESRHPTAKGMERDFASIDLDGIDAAHPEHRRCS